MPSLAHYCQNVRSYSISGSRVCTQARRSPLMIKPVTNMCVRYLAKRSCVWNIAFKANWIDLEKAGKSSLARNRWHFPWSARLMMTGNGQVTEQPNTIAPPFISGLFLWLLKGALRVVSHNPMCVIWKYTLWQHPASHGYTDLFPSWRSLCQFSPFCIQPSIWSLQSLGHIAVLSLRCISTNGTMPLFPWANPSCALTLAHCWPGFPVSVCMSACLYLCVRYVLFLGSWLLQKNHSVTDILKSRYICFNLSY